MSGLSHPRIEAARRGENPTVIRHLPSGWVVLGDWQFLPGYCLLLADPVVGSLNDLPARGRRQFLMEMALVGDALLQATDAVRINYQILGNLDPILHAHICPRYAWEAPDKRDKPTSCYDKKAGPGFDPARDSPLMDKIGAVLDRLMIQS